MVRFTTRSKVVIHPTEEWELVRAIDGNLISVHKNHLNNYVKNYAYTEFQRGDAVRFELNQNIFDQQRINLGDTIGYLYSNEEQRRLIQLRGQLGVLYSELEFYTTGQKPEDVLFARRKLELAQQELETEKKLMARTNELIKENVISQQEFDVKLNVFKLKELSVELAAANLASIDTGEKPEMAKLIQSKIQALSNEIDQIQDRLELLTIRSPIEGRIVLNHGSMLLPSNTLSTQIIIKVISDSKPIGLMPIRMSHTSAIKVNSDVKLRKKDLSGKVKSINNTAQISLSAPYLFYVVEFDEIKDFTFGEIQEVKVYGAKIPFTEFLSFYMNH